MRACKQGSTTLLHDHYRSRSAGFHLAVQMLSAPSPVTFQLFASRTPRNVPRQYMTAPQSGNVLALSLAHTGLAAADSRTIPALPAISILFIFSGYFYPMPYWHVLS